MPNFTDLAIELQEAIWKLVLPYRGIHWVEIEGSVDEAPYVHHSIRSTRHNYPDGILPELTAGDFWLLPNKCKCSENPKVGSLFFDNLVPVVPSVWGLAGPGDACGDEEMNVQLAEEVAYTRRCRQLSTYTQVATLLQTCRLSRDVAWGYIEEYRESFRLPIYRSKGLLHRPRPLDVWEAQYPSKDSSGPDYGPPHTRLVPPIRSHLDLVVFRLHDAHGRATPLLRQGPFQFPPEYFTNEVESFTHFNRVGIEWHPRWADEQDEFRAANVQSIFSLMQWMALHSTMLYWLVDGIPRPNWKRDYPNQIQGIEAWMSRYMHNVHRYQVGMDKATRAEFLADCNLDLEFEANGRRYYLVFVVIPWERWEERGGKPCHCGKVHADGPFLHGEAKWPEKLRAPARFAYNMLTDSHLRSLWTYPEMSFILSWEPI